MYAYPIALMDVLGQMRLIISKVSSIYQQKFPEWGPVPVPQGYHTLIYSLGYTYPLPVMFRTKLGKMP